MIQHKVDWQSSRFLINGGSRKTLCLYASVRFLPEIMLLEQLLQDQLLQKYMLLEHESSEEIY